MRWRIYYEDGTTYSDRDGSPFDALPAGAEVIAYEDPTSPTGFKLMHGKRGIFIWRDDSWHNVDDAGMWDYLLLTRGPKAIVVGRTMRDPAFWAMVARAADEGLG